MTASPSSDSAENNVSIRPVHAWEEFVAVEELQREVWQMPDWRDAVPANLLITAQKNGGLVLGAFDNARLVGFVFGFPGMAEADGKIKLKHCSHMLAVLPDYQSRGIGVRLKFAQCDWVCARGFDLVTWTFDPLQAVNARLNLWRLGGIARRYIPDAYGMMTNGLNAGMASDRFEIEWWVNTPRVQARAEREPPALDWDALVRAGARAVFSITFDAPNLPRIADEHELAGATLLVDIPARLSAVKAASTELAHAWRMQTRAVLQRAFAAGYIACEFVFAEHAGNRRAAYVLRRAVEGMA